MDPVTIIVLATAVSAGAAKCVEAHKQRKRKNRLGYDGKNVALVTMTLAFTEEDAARLGEEDSPITPEVERMVAHGQYITQGGALP